MDADPSKRPNFLDIFEELEKSHHIIAETDHLRLKGTIPYSVSGEQRRKKENIIIFKAFKYADEIIPTLWTRQLNYARDNLVSKFLKYQTIQESIEQSSLDVSNYYDLLSLSSNDFLCISITNVN
ncbi:hypothetical protein F8M41_011450 [Gigaspora margarita]|uniref:Uncharacterized protein n=1 Tax=Gigaspora margarita TaxID=4874 RepID=A0A8H3X227_GIGMA|nr:hypothetical protein F8M41_011450 [Gigaspora margarita]